MFKLGGSMTVSADSSVCSYDGVLLVSPVASPFCMGKLVYFVQKWYFHFRALSPINWK